MSKQKFGTGEWIIVCDGAKALVLCNIGDEKFPNFETINVRKQDNARTSESGSDRPGRVQSLASSGRSTVEQTDWHDRAEQEFLASLAEELNQAVEQGQVKNLTIVASPRALGMIRPFYSKALSSALKHEIAKDYASMPVSEIEKKLTG